MSELAASRPNVEETTYSLQWMRCRWPRCPEQWLFRLHEDGVQYEMIRLVHEESCLFRPMNQ